MPKKTKQIKSGQKDKDKNIDIFNPNKKYYFASADTCFGYKNYFSGILNPQNFEKIYVIKGSVDYGKSYKSHIINEIAQKAAEKNYYVECFYNPVNPGCLDSIIIKDLKIAVADGTNQYGNIAEYPGIVENIIDIGDLYDESKLVKNKKEILDLTVKKRDYCNSAYKFLSAANELAEYALDLIKKYIIEEKLNSAIGRILDKTIYNNSTIHEHERDLQQNNYNLENSKEYRLVNAISPSGFIELDTFENDASKIFYISNENFAGFYYTEKLLENLNHNMLNK